MHNSWAHSRSESLRSAMHVAWASPKRRASCGVPAAGWQAICRSAGHALDALDRFWDLCSAANALLVSCMVLRAYPEMTACL